MILILIAIWIVWVIVVWSVQHRIMFPTSMIDRGRVLDGPPDGI